MQMHWRPNHFLHRLEDLCPKFSFWVGSEILSIAELTLILPTEVIVEYPHSLKNLHWVPVAVSSVTTSNKIYSYKSHHQSIAIDFSIKIYRLKRITFSGIIAGSLVGQA